MTYYDNKGADYFSRLGTIKNEAFSKLELDTVYRDCQFIDTAAVRDDGCLLVRATGQGLFYYDLNMGEAKYSISEADEKFAAANGRVFAVSFAYMRLGTAPCSHKRCRRFKTRTATISYHLFII